MNDYSNYWHTSLDDRIVYYGKKVLDYSLQGFEGKDLFVNGVSKRLLVHDAYTVTNEGKRKTIIGEYGTFKCGDTIDYNDNYWLVLSKVYSDHNMYDKGNMELCNDVFVLEQEPIKTISGYDPTGRPIYKETEVEPLTINCISKNTILDYKEGTGIRLPDGELEITLPYIEDEKLIEGTVFKLNNREHTIIGLDYTDVINTVGVIRIQARRV